MMNETNIKKMEELLENEELAQKIVDAGSFENACLLFAEQGLDLSYEEFSQYIQDNLNHSEMISENGELNIEQLDSIGGGFWRGALVILIQMRQKNKKPKNMYVEVIESMNL